MSLSAADQKKDLPRIHREITDKLWPWQQNSQEKHRLYSDA